MTKVIQTGPAMEAMVRACAEAVWQMYYKPHNLTWDARKERTFDSIAAVVVETQGTLLERIRELEAEGENLKSRRVHTQEWYASHYGKLEDWARTRLPRDWRDEFFCCIANGTWGIADRGERYTCKAGFEVVPSGYIHMDDAKGQLVLDQTTRAEEAEARAEAAEAKVRELEAAAEGREVAGEYGTVRYAVEYLLKGELKWRRTMVQPLDNIIPQEEILWENPAMAATRMIGFCDFSRLLTPEELAEAHKPEPKGASK